MPFKSGSRYLKSIIGPKEVLTARPAKKPDMTKAIEEVLSFNRKAKFIFKAKKHHFWDFDGNSELIIDIYDSAEICFEGLQPREDCCLSPCQNSRHCQHHLLVLRLLLCFREVPLSVWIRKKIENDVPFKPERTWFTAAHPPRKLFEKYGVATS